MYLRKRAVLNLCLCFVTLGDHPEDVKARLKFWAQAVACTVRLCSWMIEIRKSSTERKLMHMYLAMELTSWLNSHEVKCRAPAVRLIDQLEPAGTKVPWNSLPWDGTRIILSMMGRLMLCRRRTWRCFWYEILTNTQYQSDCVLCMCSLYHVVWK